MTRAFAVWIVLVGHVMCARAEDTPSVEACIAYHRDGQAARLDGHLREATVLLGRGLHPACSPVIRAACAELLEAVERETPTIVLAARLAGADLVEVSVSSEGRVLARQLDGQPLALDPGPHTLRFESEGLLPIEERVLLRVGEKNRLVQASFAARPPRENEQTTPDERLPAATPAKRRVTLDVWDYVLVGSAGGLLVGGTLTALSARRSRDAAERTCAPLCDDARMRMIRRRTLAADAQFVLSAGALGWATLRVVLHERTRSKTLRVAITPQGVLGEVQF